MPQTQADSTLVAADSLATNQAIVQPNQVESTSTSFLDAAWTIGEHTLSVSDILVFLAVLVVTQIVVWVARVVINKAFRKKGAAVDGRQYTIQKLIVYLLYTIGVVIGLEMAGLDITILIAGSAALLVGVGLGMQHIFDDFISGFIVLFEGVIKVGDIIEVDGVVARVTKIDMRTTKVITRNGNYLIIPNSKITTQSMMNWSMETSASRFTINVGVAYGSNTELVRELLLKCALDHPAVLNDKPNRVDFIDFADSSLNFRMFVWMRRSWDSDIHLSDIRFAIDESFRTNNIKIPFPQREIYVHNEPSAKK